MPKPSMKGSGEAYQSWNSDQAIATSMIALAAMPPGLRPPTSASATSRSRSTGLPPTLGGLFVIIRPPDRLGQVTKRPVCVIPALVAGIQRKASAGAGGWLHAGNKSRHDRRSLRQSRHIKAAGRHRWHPAKLQTVRRSLQPALFLVVLRSARMQRRGQAVLHHLLGFQVGERRVQLLELL